mgnify:CR=1 FL=1
MKKLILGLFMTVLPALTLAAGGSNLHLDTMEPDHTNKPSLQRGAALFTNYCMGCHSLEYARYKRIAEDLEIPDELYEENLIFTGAKIGERCGRLVWQCASRPDAGIPRTGRGLAVLLLPCLLQR